MLKIKQAVIVEGKYDKIKLSGIIDATIIDVGGFRIYKDKKMLELLKTLGKTCGVIIITDSDASGFKIRNYLKSCLKDCNVSHLYIPDVLGKEKRKHIPSKEGKIGVEGIDEKTLISLFETIGCVAIKEFDSKKITKTDLYSDGLSGTDGASVLRGKLISSLKLPEHISANSLLAVLNSLYNYENYKLIVSNLHQKENEYENKNT